MKLDKNLRKLFKWVKQFEKIAHSQAVVMLAAFCERERAGTLSKSRLMQTDFKKAGR